jgi:hypothetical protein
MNRCVWLLVLLSINSGVRNAPAGQPRLPLHVLYVGKADSARATDFAGLLKDHFARVTVADRVGFDPTKAAGADVVLLDWSQTETRSQEAESPFGKIEEWRKPTVLLGSAGLLLAGPWQIIGGAG